MAQSNCHPGCFECAAAIAHNPRQITNTMADTAATGLQKAMDQVSVLAKSATNRCGEAMKLVQSRRERSGAWDEEMGVTKPAEPVEVMTKQNKGNKQKDIPPEQDMV